MNIRATSPALDELLLDVCTSIELSDNDRRIAESRYRRLKEHLERSTSPLRPYLVDGDSRIYAQGSMAIGTTIVSGDKDDRYDVDAIVELNVPAFWDAAKVLDSLFEGLQDFPDAVEVARCTRCVQIGFAVMHMDVTVMDPATPPRIERAGNIFHSSDKGEQARIPANPWGFAQWFRSVVPPNARLAESIASRRTSNGIDRLLHRELLAKVDQDNLPAIIPPRVDAEQAVSLKLFKRYVNLKYFQSDLRRPPSVYLTKMAADVGAVPTGLTDQLIALSLWIAARMEETLNSPSLPDERNPTYNDDRLNDRWPKTQRDKDFLQQIASELADNLQRAKRSSILDILSISKRLFGERVTERSFEVLTKRFENTGGNKSFGYEKGTGTVIVSAAALSTPAVVRSAPAQTFHKRDFVFTDNPSIEEMKRMKAKN